MSNNLTPSSKKELAEQLEEAEAPRKGSGGHTCLLHKKPLPCEDCNSGSVSWAVAGTTEGRDKIY